MWYFFSKKKEEAPKQKEITISGDPNKKSESDPTGPEDDEEDPEPLVILEERGMWVHAPPNATPGMELLVRTIEGEYCRTIIPDGIGPGDQFRLKYFTLPDDLPDMPTPRAPKPKPEKVTSEQQKPVFSFKKGETKLGTTGYRSKLLPNKQRGGGAPKKKK